MTGGVLPVLGGRAALGPVQRVRGTGVVTRSGTLGGRLAGLAASPAGAIVLVSHDRHLIGLVCDTFWRVAGGVAQPFDGDLDDYAAWLRSKPGNDSGTKSPVATPAPAAPASAPAPPPAPAPKKTKLNPFSPEAMDQVNQISDVAKGAQPNTTLADATVQQLALAAEGRYDAPELQAVIEERHSSAAAPAACASSAWRSTSRVRT